MKAAMLVPRVAADPAANLHRVEQMTVDVAGLGAELVLLPEAVLTGLINNDDPAPDLPMGRQIRLVGIPRRCRSMPARSCRRARRLS